MFGLKKMMVPAAIAALMTVGGGFVDDARAATCMFGTETDFTATADVWTSTDCVGQLSRNDSEGAFNTGGFFGSSNWTLDTKIEVAEDKSGGSTTYSFELPPETPGILNASLEADALSGLWNVTSWVGIEKAALVLKGGSGYAGYLLDLTAGTNGGWSTQALTVGSGNQPALSHVSLYTTPAPIPLPAGGLLLITALGGLGIAARRRRKSA